MEIFLGYEKLSDSRNQLTLSSRPLVDYFLRYESDPQTGLLDAGSHFGERTQRMVRKCRAVYRIGLPPSDAGTLPAPRDLSPHAPVKTITWPNALIVREVEDTYRCMAGAALGKLGSRSNRRLSIYDISYLADRKGANCKLLLERRRSRQDRLPTRLQNTSKCDAAVTALANHSYMIGIFGAHRRLRCMRHTFRLVTIALVFTDYEDMIEAQTQSPKHFKDDDKRINLDECSVKDLTKNELVRHEAEDHFDTLPSKRHESRRLWLRQRSVPSLHVFAVDARCGGSVTHAVPTSAMLVAVALSDEQGPIVKTAAPGTMTLRVIRCAEAADVDDESKQILLRTRTDVAEA
ncbi:hypothetical protein PSPO01_16532, partial [Paraphaeosphaeria sporulosa]